MVYGILIESVVHFIRQRYDKIVFEQIQEYLECDLSNINLFEIYEDRLMVGLAEGIIKLSFIFFFFCFSCFFNFNQQE